jgi:predicted dehydrogenase
VSRPGAAAPLGVGVVGLGWMGQVHARAHLRVPHHFPELPLRPVLVAAADPEPGRAAAAAARYGFARSTLDWREVVEDPAVHAVSVTAPNHLHREIGVAAARAGKHLWVEKPVGVDAADARAVRDAVRAAGVASAVGFNYRYVPAVAAAKRLLAAGALGEPTHARFHLFSDYAAHPRGALSWRFERARGGTGVLGDLASHGIDLARYLLGEIEALVADCALFVPSRPRPTGTGSHFALAEGGEPGPVENEDYVSCLLRLAGGARATLEACRVSVAEQCRYGFEVHGTRGMLCWDFRRMGELGVSTGGEYQNQSTRTVFVGPGDGAYGDFQPGAGIAMGYDDLKVIEAAHLLRAIHGDGDGDGAGMADAVCAAAAVEAMMTSARTGTWVGPRP